MTEIPMLPTRESEFDASWGWHPPAPPQKLKPEHFQLPGHGDRSAWCGEWRGRICREHEKHVDSSLDGLDVVGKDIIEWYHASCGRIQCPVCYEKAAGKMAITIAWRFKHAKSRRAAIHVVASVPPSMYDVDPRKLRSMAEERLKECGVHGGSIMFHPWRERCAKCGAEVDREDGKHLCVECGSVFVVWILSLHFHCIGFGWTSGEKVAAMYERTGWIIHNFGFRKSVRATAQYQLSHCGVAKGFSNVVWFGSMMRMKYPKLPAEEHACPSCGGKMEKLLLDVWTKTTMKSGFMDNVEEGFFFVDPGMFDYRDQPGDGG